MMQVVWEIFPAHSQQHDPRGPRLEQEHASIVLSMLFVMTQQIQLNQQILWMETALQNL